ncbi:response regulator [Colwellia sp. D2M02]|uniref:response regulator n=1 Tax=Colwellia sp. D2M02 TaxID=2841562 RepID=UPI00209150F8|nr:response regulator [Colwellia sp. D2M02]
MAALAACTSQGHIMDKRLINLLLVEDDEDDYILALDYLQEIPDFEFNVKWLSDYDLIMQSLQDEPFDLCLLDYQLGAHTGLSVLEAAKNMGCATPFIMLTGQSDGVLDAQALTLGAEDFLVKSEINSVQFIRAIRYALARKDIAIERLERLKIESDSRAKDRFLAHLSHELRTPLTSIIGYTDLLLSRAELDSIKPELSIVHSNSQHLLALLNDVLDLSKIRENTLSLNKSNFALSPFLADLQNLFGIAAQKKGLLFTIEADTPVPEFICSDATRLKQVLINIIYNAIKFTQSGEIRVLLTFEQKHNQSVLNFSIRDTGIGIPQEKLKRIFNPFEQVQDTTTRTEEGAGLGLAISASLIKLLGGNFQVDSVLGQGSTFTFLIDTGVSSENLVNLNLQQPVALQHKALTTNDTLQGNVLIVEDVSNIRLLLTNIISATGAKVTSVDNGQKALTLLSDEQQHFDLVFLDLHMPIMGGREVVVAARSQQITTPIVALTAAALKGSEETLQALGFDQVLTKPIDTQQLHECLTHHLSAASNERDALESEQPIATQTKKVLLLEDDKDARELMGLLLKSLGIEVFSAQNIQESLRVYQQEQRFDLVILDLNLPDGSGFDAAQAIKNINATQQLAIISGSEPEPESLVALGINHVLLKPVSLPDLQKLIE